MKSNSDFRVHHGALMNGILLGLLIGAVVGLLIAPSSGQKLRRRLTRAAAQPTKQIVASVEQQMTDPVTASLEAGKAAARRRRADLDLPP